MSDTRTIWAAVAICALLALPSIARATGLRIEGQWVTAGDSSFDVLSSEDVRSSLDVSFSYSVLYLKREVLLDLEAGYIHYMHHGDTLFDTFSTGILGHGMYVGIRLQFRHDADYLEILQPYIRADFGWAWTRVALKDADGLLPGMEDWGDSGFIYAGGGIQITLPGVWLRKIRLPGQLSIGFTYEVGYTQPGPIEIRLRPEPTSSEGPEPIPIDGVRLGSLDLAGLTHKFGLVVTF